MRKHRVDVVLVILAVIFLAVGLLVMYAIGPRVALAEGKPENTYFVGHVRSIAMAVIAMLAGAIFFWRDKVQSYWKEHKTQIIKIFWWGTIALNIYTSISALPLTQCELGACRWLNVGMSFQPSELLKIAALFYTAWLVSDRKEKGTYGKAEFWVPLLVAAALVVVIVGFLQKDLGNTVVIIFMMGLMSFVAGMTWAQIAIAGLLVVVGAFALLNMGDSEHRADRLASFSSGSYHGDNALVSFGTGGLTGVGIGNSISATGYLPEAISDSIFPIIGEIGGFFGAMLLLIGYLIMLYRIQATSHRMKNAEDRMLVIGVFAWILAHVIMHVGGMVGMIPMKGTTLPFLSYGGSSLMCVAFAYGIVLQKSCWTQREDINEDTSSRGRQRGTRDAGYRRRS